nr:MULTISPECIES: thiolase family protein [unclassified Mycolicibacterium]
MPHRTGLDLAQEAVFGAIADAGLTPADIDGVAADWPGPGGTAGEPGSWARVFGRNLSWISDGMLDTSGSRGLLKAAAAIDAGLCDVAVVGGGMAGQFGRGGSVGPGLNPLEFTDVWGGYVVPLFALIATSHMHQFGTTPEQMSAVAATVRNNGHINPEAVMYGRGPYTVADVLASPMLASPLHRLHICMAAEGGAAMVLARMDRARDLKHRPVRVLGGGLEFSGAPYVDPPQYRTVGRLGERAAERALRLADVGITDIDVFNLYDPNAFEIIRQVEVLGLCGEGEGGPFVESGHIALDGQYPVNPDGGCLSYAWNGTQQMTLKVIECVRQLRGQAVNQIADARLALAATAGSAAGHYEISVLGTD